MKWITRSNVKVDRVACPWLIRRFVDPEAEFLFVTEEQLLDIAEKERAIPFDATRFPEVKLNHRGERCTFGARMSKDKKKLPRKALDCARSLRVSRYLGSVTRSAWSGSSRSTTHYTNSFATSRTER